MTALRRFIGSRPARRAAPFVPAWMKERVRRRLVRPRPGPFAWGDLRSLQPLSSLYGFDRGTPVDRALIERFLSAYRSDIRGHVLEVADANYTQVLGQDVTRSEVLDIDPQNPNVTVLADLNIEGALPTDAYDCIIFTQTLQFLREPEVGLSNVTRALRHDGTLLLTAPCVSRLDPTAGRDADYWRYTPIGLETFLRSALPEADIRVSAYGNVLLCVSFLLGIAVEELDPQEIAHDDPDFPLIVGARVQIP